MDIKKFVFSSAVLRTARPSLAAACALALVSGAAQAGSAAAVILMQQQQQQQQAQGASTAQSPQVCPPAGYVTSRDVGYASGPIRKDGELRYCVLKDPSPWVKPQCSKYISAQEYVQAESGRSDAVYSGMALQGSSPTNIVLFYCLPKH
jgi:hypothetical protein